MNDRPMPVFWIPRGNAVSSPSRSAAGARAIADDEDGTR
jgi:hypothetical protein